MGIAGLLLDGNRLSRRDLAKGPSKDGTGTGSDELGWGWDGMEGQTKTQAASEAGQHAGGRSRHNSWRSGWL